MDDQIKEGISVGYLPYLFLGQHFLNGDYAPLSAWREMKELEFEIDTSNKNSISEVVLADIGIDYATSGLIEYGNRKAAYKIGFKLLRGYKHENNIREPYEIIIHEMELIRFYLTNSEYSCKQIFNGAFQDDLIFKKVINNIHNELNYDEKTKFGTFVYRHGYSKIDGSSLGRILFEPEGRALKAAQRVYKTITSDRLNNSGTWVGYPRADFPFSGTSRLRLSGRWLKTKTSMIYLANRILGCSSRFPFKKLQYYDEVLPGGASPPEDADIAFSGANRKEHGPANEETGNQDQGHSVSDQRPSSLSEPLKALLHKRIYGGLMDTELIFEKFRDSTFRGRNKVQKYLNHLINASTGAGTSGETTSVRQHIAERIIRPSKLTADLKTFVAILNGLRKLQPDWKINTIRVGDGYFEDEWYSFFPEVRSKKSRNIMLRFSFMDKAKEISRRFICVSIEIDGKHLYLFEAQSRTYEDPISGKLLSYEKSLSILLLYKAEYGVCTPEDFTKILIDTVKNGAWPIRSVQYEFNLDYTVHGRGVQLEEEMIRRIYNLIMRNVSG